MKNKGEVAVRVACSSSSVSHGGLLLPTTKSDSFLRFFKPERKPTTDRSRTCVLKLNLLIIHLSKSKITKS